MPSNATRRWFAFIDGITCGLTKRIREKKMDVAFRLAESEILKMLNIEVAMKANISKLRIVNSALMLQWARAGGKQSKSPTSKVLMADYLASSAELVKKNDELERAIVKRTTSESILTKVRGAVDANEREAGQSPWSVLFSLVPSIDAVTNQHNQELRQLEQLNEFDIALGVHETEKAEHINNTSPNDDDGINEEAMDALTAYMVEFQHDETMQLEMDMLELHAPSREAHSTSNVYVGEEKSSNSMTKSLLTNQYIESADLDGDIDTT